MEKKDKIGIVGLGLIGGSLALALRGKYDVVGMSRKAETTAYALSVGMVSSVAEKYEDFAGCKAVVVCTPLALVRETVESLAKTLGDGVIISDVGSVKGNLVGVKGRIIGGHPMAGTEESGVRSAKEGLFENACYVLVDYNGNAGDLEYMKKLVTDACAVPVVMCASEHDALVAKISHLEHVAAYSLVSSAVTGEEKIVGSGFMDTTRIASSSPDFWATVMRLNKDNILKELDEYIKTLQAVKEDVEAGRDLAPFFAKAKEKRDKLSYKKRYMTEYVVYVDVPDVVGSISGVLAELAKAGVSISNLSVMDSREGASGALRIELKDEFGYKKAKELFK